MPVLAVTAAVTLLWIAQASGTKASLRGLDAVSSKVVWASGTDGTYLETIDAGEHWKSARISGAETLDFRGVKAFDERTAFLLASGPGNRSRVYKTSDAGNHWRLLFTNPDVKGFFDAIAFWDRKNGMVLGDPVAGEFAVFTTGDGGEHWNRQQTPAALPNEGAFAASNTSLVVRGAGEAWFGTGGPNAARVFRTADRGRTWSLSTTPLSAESASSGIYSLAFRDESHGVAAGGD